MRARTVIIGGGIAGLTAAAILSRHMETVLLERDTRLGGKIETREINGARIDCGPTVLTLRPVFETIFQHAGTRLDDCLQLTPLHTLARHFWSDGSTLDLFSNQERTYHAIEAFSSPRSAAQYLKFSALAQTVFETLTESFMLRSDPNFLRLITSRSLRRLFGLNPFDSLWQVLSRMFDDLRLVQLFARYATYCGSSPFECPATLMLVSHVERLGVWTLPGGISDLALALRDQAIQNGAEIRTGAEVSAIDMEHGQISGVHLNTGERIPAHGVICTGDIRAVDQALFGTDAQSAISSRTSDTPSQSAITWTLSAKSDGPPLNHHNVFFSDDYPAEFDAVFARRQVPQDPTVYLCAPHTEASSAKFCLINAPADGDTHTYSNQEVEQCQTRMMQTLQKCGLQLSVEPETIKVSTPTTYAQRFPGTGGALYGPASHGWRAAFQRQGVRTRRMGLYMAGGSVHPGPGVPMAALSGRAAALQLLSDFDLITPRQQADMRGGISMV